MKNIKIIFRYTLMILLLMVNFAAFSQTVHKNLRYGDEHYYKEEYGESEESYRKALLQDTNSVNANYNLGNVLYQQERFNEAANYYAEAVENATNEGQKANAYHNLGNANLAQLEGLNNPEQQQTALNQGIEAYKNALKINPEDNSTKYNLAYAQRLLKQMQQNPPPQQQNGNGDNQEQPEQQEDNQEQQPQQKPEQEKEEEEEKQEPKQKPGEMSKKEAERLLKIMEEEERKVQDRINKEKAKANPKNKDW